MYIEVVVWVRTILNHVDIKGGIVPGHKGALAWCVDPMVSKTNISSKIYMLLV